MTHQQRLSDEQRQQIRNSAAIYHEDNMPLNELVDEIESIVYPDESKPLQAEAVGGNSVEEMLRPLVINVRGQQPNHIRANDFITFSHALQAMTEYAASQVAIQTEAKDKEIAELKDHIKTLTALKNNKPRCPKCKSESLTTSGGNHWCDDCGNVFKAN